MRWTLLLLAACGSPGDADPPTWHADVAPIIEGRCAGCHTEGGVAPVPLRSFEEVAAVGNAVAILVEDRAMPPWKAEPGHLDYAGDPSLTDEQIDTIVAWVDAGMPEGDPADHGDPLPDLSVALPRADHTLEMPEDYLPAVDPDDYRCFVIDWPGAETEYVTGFEVRPGNGSIVHHVAAFLIRPDNPMGEGVFDTFAAWDEEEAGPGYTCFGGPSGSEDLAIPIQQLAQWVPGSGAVLFPDGVGIPVPPGSKIVLQLHYNTASGDGNPDRTSVDFTIEPEVERIGAFAPWLDATWTFGAMTLPAGEVTTHEAQGSPFAFFDLLLDDIDLSGGFDIHAAMLHMHTLGAEGLIRVDRAGGSEQVVLEVADWDFDWQLNYQLAAPLPFGPEDELYVGCTFDNTAGSTDVGWGEGSGEEMCVANLFVSAPFTDPG